MAVSRPDNATRVIIIINLVINFAVFYLDRQDWHMNDTATASRIDISTISIITTTQSKFCTVSDK